MISQSVMAIDEKSIIFEPLSTDFRFCIQHEYLYPKKVFTSCVRRTSRTVSRGHARYEW